MKSNLLRDFIKEIQYENRNPCETRVLKLLDDKFTNPHITIPVGEKLYRCRVIKNEDDLEKNREPNFYGYNSKESFVPPRGATRDMRANYRYIPYLYCANDPYLSLIETRPRLGAKVSIATITVTQKLVLLDFTVQHKPKKMPESKYNLFSDLSELYSKPIADDDNTLDYIPTQFIAEYAKKLGYDGIIFTSSLAPEIVSANLDLYNVVVFNFEKCAATRSNVLCVTENYFGCRQIDGDLQRLSVENCFEEQLNAI